MKKTLSLLCITLFGLALAYARENPFKPLIDNTVLPVTSNNIRKTPPFKGVQIALPADARVLTSVVIFYQSIDGSIKKKMVAVDKAIDWHKPIIVTQEGIGTKAHIEKRGKTKSGAKEKKSVEKRKKADKKRRFAPFSFLSIEVEKKRVHIVTKDEKIRSFHLTHPFKVAIDFRRKAGFLTRHIPLDIPPFKAIDIGNHDGYYRVVVTFDAPYRYKIKKSGDGYTLEVR
ncbi:AMIN domain-containing protein [Hydrogenimonas sp.]